MNLYLKHRPAKLKHMIGNKSVISALDAMLDDIDTIPHALLFTGPTGTGKTTLARIVANRIGALESDLVEVDSADFRGIDTVRRIIQQSRLTAMYGVARVWIIDECHKMTNDAQNAMLKLLEDTPKNAYFILCTTDPQKLIATVKSRCTPFEMKTLTDREIQILLKSIIKAEDAAVHPDAIEQITEDSNGHPRNALQILDQVIRVSEDEQLAVAEQSALQQNKSIELCRALLNQNGWKQVSSILDGLRKEDPESIRRHVLGYCSSVLLKKDNEQAGIIMEEFIEPFYNTNFAGLVFACYTVVKG